MNARRSAAARGDLCQLVVEQLWLIVQSRSITLAWKLLDTIRVDGGVAPDTSQ